MFQIYNNPTLYRGSDDRVSVTSNCVPFNDNFILFVDNLYTAILIERKIFDIEEKVERLFYRVKIVQISIICCHVLPRQMLLLKRYVLILLR